MKIIRILLCTLGILAFVSRSDASPLYATSAAGTAGELYTLNPATGAMLSDVGPLNDLLSVNYGITGLAFHPTTGLLYGSTGNSAAGTQAKLVTINPTTGLVTLIGSFNAGPTNSSGVPATMADIGFDAAGNLYGVGSIGGPQLYSINILTGQATAVGGGTGLTSTSGGGMAISPTGVIYGTPTSTRFGTYDLGTGAYVNIAAPTRPVGGAYASLDFDGGILYGINLGPSPALATHLVTFNLTTGAITDLGGSVTALDAIAFQPVPEPSTIALLLGSTAVFAFTAIRRRK